MKDAASDVTITGKNFSLRFDKQLGVITSYAPKGTSLLERGPRPDFWRAPTDNDNGGLKTLRERAETDTSTTSGCGTTPAPTGA